MEESYLYKLKKTANSNYVKEDILRALIDRQYRLEQGIKKGKETLRWRRAEIKKCLAKDPKDTSGCADTHRDQMRFEKAALKRREEELRKLKAKKKNMKR